LLLLREWVNSRKSNIRPIGVFFNTANFQVFHTSQVELLSNAGSGLLALFFFYFLLFLSILYIIFSHGLVR
jgi:hypothetical protein